MGRRLLAAYVVLLVASHVVRGLADSDAKPAPGDRAIAVQEVAGEQLADRLVTIAYDEARPAATHDRLPVILLHGSPGRRGDHDGMAMVLASRRQVFSVDLPGFGASTREIPDYSIRAHAHYVVQFLDALGIDRVHVVGYSMGGGVALHVADLVPRRVRSLSLLSAIGVQELELLGNYHVNRALHAVQLGALWLAREALPHFGLLDDTLVGVPYARNFYESDQRPLRHHLLAYDGPVFILHGEDDLLVPVAVAHEHARLAPQARVEIWPGGHFTVLHHGVRVGMSVGAFLDDVAASQARRRADVSRGRLARSREPYDPARQPPFSGAPLVVLMLLAAAATLLSEDLTCIVMGALVGHGRVEFLPAFVACFLGIFLGDLLIFYAGRTLGRGAVRRAPLRWWLSEGHVERASAWIQRRGVRVIFFSRFLPALRVPTYFALGLLRTSFWGFALTFAAAVAMSTLALVWLASIVGGGLAERLSGPRLTIIVLIAVGVLLILARVLPALFRSGRRSRSAPVLSSPTEE